MKNFFEVVDSGDWGMAICYTVATLLILDFLYNWSGPIEDWFHYLFHKGGKRCDNK
ncbi:MAG: hypothetical protein HY764_00245 [Candidatus Portnoybacteria bacterium]|nr:hypothetical protein [Candidatus Portnoybacteria bacterium]